MPGPPQVTLVSEPQYLLFSRVLRSLVIYGFFIWGTENSPEGHDVAGPDVLRLKTVRVRPSLCLQSRASSGTQVHLLTTLVDKRNILWGEFGKVVIGSV